MANKVNELAANLADLDFNVSDEEISLAKKIWLDNSESHNFLNIKHVQHPM
jgi:hypothetical protein